MLQHPVWSQYSTLHVAVHTVVVHHGRLPHRNLCASLHEWYVGKSPRPRQPSQPQVCSVTNARTGVVQTKRLEDATGTSPTHSVPEIQLCLNQGMALLPDSKVGKILEVGSSANPVAIVATLTKPVFPNYWYPYLPIPGLYKHTITDDFIQGWGPICGIQRLQEPGQAQLHINCLELKAVS